MKLTSAQNDRASGAMLAMACGDALGAGYEFGPPFEGEVLMKGGNGFNWAKTAPDVGVQTSGVLCGIESTTSAARARMP